LTLSTVISAVPLSIMLMIDGNGRLADPMWNSPATMMAAALMSVNARSGLAMSAPPFSMVMTSAWMLERSIKTLCPDTMLTLPLLLPKSEDHLAFASVWDGCWGAGAGLTTGSDAFVVDGGVAVDDVVEEVVDDVVGALVVEDVLSATAVVGAALVVDARVVELVVDARVVELVVAALEVVLALTVELVVDLAAEVADPLHDCVLVIVYGIVMVEALFPILKRPVAATGKALQTSILITPFTMSCVRAPPLALNVSYRPLCASVAKMGVIWDTS